MPVFQNERQGFFSLEKIDLLLREFKMNRLKNVPEGLKDSVLHDTDLFSLHTAALAGGIFKVRGRNLHFKNGRSFKFPIPSGGWSTGSGSTRALPIGGAR